MAFTEVLGSTKLQLKTATVILLICNVSSTDFDAGKSSAQIWMQTVLQTFFYGMGWQHR